MRGGERRRKPAVSGQLSRRERRTLLRLLVSAAILLLTVGVRILLPELAETVGGRLRQAMNVEMDVQEVFSAVGRAVSGAEEEGWDDVYRAVFAPAAEPSAALSGYQTADGNGAEPLTLYDDANTPERVTLTQETLGFAFAAPVTAAVRSRFGLRSDPFTGEEDFHYGVDLAAAEGTAVAAFAAGTVRTVGDSAILGNYLILDHDGGCSTLYAHCSRILAEAGKEITLGETVAEVGQSGSATGPHLHFELHRGSQYLNPVYYLA